MSDVLIGAGERASRQVRAACYAALVEVAMLRSEYLPGITETLLDRVAMNVTQGRGSPLGYFMPDCWTAAGNVFSEVMLDLNREEGHPTESLAEDLLTTLIHELAHAYAHHMGIKDTSNRGRYHSMKFGRIAFALGLSIVNTKTYIGMSTPGLTQESRELFGDVLRDLEEQVTMQPHRPSWKSVSVDEDDADDASGPGLSTGQTEGSQQNGYVSATCGCATGGGRARRIRVARGSWLLGSITCGVCRQPFTESLTGSGQGATTPSAAAGTAARPVDVGSTHSTFEREEAIIQHH